MYDLKRWCITVRGNLVGFERSRVYIQDKPYLDRWIIYFGLGTLRLHKFWRGDDDRAFHDHPWAFWTFPLSSYIEKVRPGASRRVVKAFRWHYRPADFQHIVVARANTVPEFCSEERMMLELERQRRPFYTIVVTGNRIRGWGFWPEGKPFVPWREWK